MTTDGLPGDQTVKTLPAVQETWIQSEQGRSPGEENGFPLQYFSWRILWTENPGGLQSWGYNKSDTTNNFTFFMNADNNKVRGAVSMFIWIFQVDKSRNLRMPI